MASTDKVFAGSIPDIYDSLLVPLIFEPYARDMAARVAASGARSILETAAGTGVVTRALAARAPGLSITATDLNEPMLARARTRLPDHPVSWRQADAMALPFPDGSFDAVLCQFGAMFFPDKVHAFGEARRVLRPGGFFAFSVWDDIRTNDFAHAVTQALAAVFPDDPPRFLARTPHGSSDSDLLRRQLAQAGFGSVEIDRVTHRSRAANARDPAVAYCHGTPLRAEIEARGSVPLADATDAVAQALEGAFGAGPVDGRIQALVATARPR